MKVCCPVCLQEIKLKDNSKEYILGKTLSCLKCETDFTINWVDKKKYS